MGRRPVDGAGLLAILMRADTAWRCEAAGDCPSREVAVRSRFSAARRYMFVTPGGGAEPDDDLEAPRSSRQQQEPFDRGETFESRGALRPAHRANALWHLSIHLMPPRSSPVSLEMLLLLLLGLWLPARGDGEKGVVRSWMARTSILADPRCLSMGVSKPTAATTAAAASSVEITQRTRVTTRFFEPLSPHSVWRRWRSGTSRDSALGLDESTSSRASTSLSQRERKARQQAIAVSSAANGDDDAAAPGTTFAPGADDAALSSARRKRSTRPRRSRRRQR